MKSYLTWCEDFYSIQGEGPSVGAPAVFLRLAACNLQCNGFSYQDPLTGEHLGCDTKAVWRKGQRLSFDKLFARFEKKGYLHSLAQGAHLVITGGEPTLQQSKLIGFIELLDSALSQPCYIELETNATQSLQPAFLQRINQINASPKLAFSGELKSKRYILPVLEQLAAMPHAFFKFVIQNEADVQEIQADFQDCLSLENQRIWLMAEGGCKDSLQKRAPEVVELCKKYGFNYSTRLHIDLWDEATGV